LILLCFLATPFFVSAQYKGTQIRVEPALAKPGKSITLFYDPSGTKLSESTAVTGVVYWLRTTENPIAQEFNLEKSGKFFKSTLSVPDTVQAFCILFREGKKTDNNNDKSYAFLLYGNDNKPLAGSYASLGLLYSKNYYYSGMEDRDIELARTLIEDEFLRYPRSKRTYFGDYIFMFDHRRKGGKDAQKKELDKFSARADLTEEEYGYLISGYEGLDLKKQANALVVRKENKYGKPVDRLSIYREFRVRKPLAEMKSGYEKLQNQFPKKPKLYEIQYMKYSYQTYLQMLADSAQCDDFHELIENAPQDYGQTTMYVYNKLAWDWAEKDQNFERAAMFSKETAEWSRKKKDEPRSTQDDTWRTDEQLREQREQTYATYADTYGYVLDKQGKTSEAVAYLHDAAVVYGKRKAADMNERYISVLAKIKPEEVEKEASIAIGTGKGTTRIEEILRASYLKTHPQGNGYDQYLAALKQKAADQLKSEVKEKMISLPAPAFSLLDLEGKPVSLEGLKGKIVVVDFWATWCGPCVSSFPAMQKAVIKYKDNPDVAFLFVNTWQQETDKRKNAADFINKKRYPFHVLMDEKDDVITDFKVSGIPTKFVINKEGIVRFKSVGFAGGDDGLVQELSMMIDLAAETVN